ncbi:AAA domain-containing protein [Streptococcus suis]|nr:AAA domain-containing protein [Streptococcus suis]NQJ69862.1 AAA domain-containing protein [Streptococcus suis]HEM6278686.1 AAA family ATPase [Streptococcus suis]
MSEYKVVDKFGNVSLSTYNQDSVVTGDSIVTELEDVFSIYNHSVSISKRDNFDIYDVDFYDDSNNSGIVVVAKGLTPGGRSNLNDEQRIQIPAKNLKTAFHDSKTAVIFALYKIDDISIICAWKIVDTESDNPISKQIKIDTIAEAVKNGFSQQKFRNKDEYVCAFRKEFLYFYLKNISRLHSSNYSVFDNKDIVDEIVEQENIVETSNSFTSHVFDVGCNLRTELIQEIRFGAPGTGKSYSIKNIIRKSYPEYKESDSNPFVLRTTIHGEYSHFDFVGNVMPISKNGVVGYEFTEGIFTTALIRAMLNKENDVYLIIEEMSRGDIASIFGDVFQLLDRNEQGVSEYRIDNSLISDELVKNGAKSKGDDKIYLPSNLHIIGTVNTSDQNVNVLDTAFKRRFSFVYESVKPSYNTEDGKILNSAIFNLGGKEFEWNQFYLSVNQFIVSDLGLSEDKQLGQFFVKFNEGVDVNETIKNKVLHYLWEDVQNASMSDEVSIFNNEIRAFSILYDKFDKDTTASEIFSDAFLETYDDQKVELSKQQNE